MRLLRTALGNRGIARLEAGWATASLGAWTFSIVLALYAYYEDGPGAVALAVAARMLPAALLGPLAERLVAGYARRTVLVGSGLVRFALLEAIALVVSAELPFELLLALAAGFEIAGSVQRTARTALVLELARTPAELAAASIGRFVDYAGFLAGAVVAGVLLATGGLDTAFAVAGLAFLAVAAITWRLPAGAPSPSAASGTIEPLRAVARHSWMRLRVGLFGASALVQSMLELLLVVAALDLLGLGVDGVGWLRAALAAGGLVGGAVAVTLLARGRLAVGLAAGLAFAGVPLALLSAWPETVPALLFLLLLGGGYAVLETALLLLTQRLAPADALARVAAVEELVYPIARAAGTGLAAWLVVQFGDKEAIVVSGVLLPALAVLSIAALRKAERGASVPDRAFQLLRGLPAFATLPTATIENLAVGAVSKRFEAGEQIGEGFHAIEEGTVERGDSRLGAGESFGEGALLRDVPAGSTATALTPVTTLTIARPDFMSRVTAPRPRAASRPTRRDARRRPAGPAPAREAQ